MKACALGEVFSGGSVNDFKIFSKRCVRHRKLLSKESSKLCYVTLQVCEINNCDNFFPEFVMLSAIVREILFISFS